MAFIKRPSLGCEINSSSKVRQMGCDEENEFSENYLILKPKNASLGDVFKCVLPFSSGNSDHKIKKLIDCPDGEEHSYSSFKARWTISVSILVQKFLLAVATTTPPLPTLEEEEEEDAHLIRSEFLPIERKNKPKKRPMKKVVELDGTVRPGRASTSPELIRRPIIRERDWRIMDHVKDNNNDNNNNNDFKYYGSLTMMASRLAYQDYSFVRSVVNDCWQMNLLGCYNFWNEFLEKATTHAFMFETSSEDPNVTVVAFRGTNPLDAHDWMVDFNFSWYKIKGVGHIHSGFMQALGLQKATGWPKDLTHKPHHDHDFAYYSLRYKLRHIAKTNHDAKFIFTGHSLGGALATLFVTLLSLHNESTILNKIQAVYTYGQPRVGDQQFAEFMVNTIQTYGFKYHRFVYSFDLVPRVPFDSALFNYKHFGGCVYFDSFYNGKFLKEHPNINYFSVIWLIPKYLSALWELIRSLIITPLLKGRDHFEGFATILHRFFGLLIPGLSAHICPNYVNLTRWGKIHVLPDRDHEEKTLTCARYIEADY